METEKNIDSTSTIKVSLRHIAEALGVSRMTVSRAFKKDGQIKAELRAKILKTAEDMGYKPDTMISELMTSFVNRRPIHYLETFAVIWWPERWHLANTGHKYDADILRGLNEGAQLHGRGIDHFVLSDEFTPKVIKRILKARNIQGVIFAPPTTAQATIPELGWDDFSIVLFGSSLHEPNFHRAQASHYNAMVQTLETLSARGFKRPCLLSRSDLEKRMSRAYAAAFLAYEHPAEHIWHATSPASEGLESWLNTVDPDVIIADCDPWLEELPYSMQSRSFVSLCVNESGGDISGIFQNTERIAKCAVDLLVRARLTLETGIPTEPVLMLTVGTWIEGKTLKTKKTRSSFKKKKPKATFPTHANSD